GARETRRRPAGVGQEREHERQPFVDKKRHEKYEDDLAESPDHAQDSRPLLQPQMQAPRQVDVDPPSDPEPAKDQDPHGQAEPQGGRRGKAHLSQKRLTQSRLPRRRDRFLEAPGDHHASFIERLAVHGVEVTFEDPEHEDSVDEDLETLGHPRYPDGAWSPARESLTNALTARR